MNPNGLILSSSNWNDFFERVSVLENTKEKGDVFERFTQLYLQAAPKYRLLLKKVQEPDVDFGIDFLAQTYDKQTLSIQAKFRSNSDSENIAFCMVVHTTTKPVKKYSLFRDEIRRTQLHINMSF